MTHLKRLLPPNIGRFLTPALGLALLCAAPFVTDGQTANSAACCNLASSLTASIFQGGNGDEDFFNLPAGPPNVMMVLDNSSSMLDFPNPLPFPTTWPASGGTCSTGTVLDNVTTSNTPYDNGYTTSFSNGTTLLNDSPPWGLAKCTTANSCLFKGTSYYMWHPNTPDSWFGYVASGWTTSTATELTLAQVCSSTRVNNTSECQTCLANAGYYLFKDKANGNQGNASFTGAFLNGYPPKFVIARKVIKDIISIDDSRPSPLDNVRFGFTTLNPQNAQHIGISSSLSQYDGGLLVVPLGPDCTNYPMTNAAQQVPRQAIIDAINSPSVVYFYTPGGIGTPLAETLYNVGQYFSDTSATGNSGLYSNLFGQSWTNTSFAESAQGAPNPNNSNKPFGAAWAGANQHSICWACQQSSAVIVTDGQPSCDNNLPQGTNSPWTHSTIGTPPHDDFVNWSNATIDCPGCGTDPNNGTPNLLHKVAYFLNHTDLRSDSFKIGSSQISMTGSQTVTTYTISFGLDPNVDLGVQTTLLQKAADLGGGIFANSDSGDSLNQALYNAITAVVSRATSFSNANTSTLQTAGKNQIFLTRFRPHSGPAWEGHVYRFRLFYEFAQGCDGTKPTSAQTLVACQKYDHTTGAPTGTVMLNPNLNSDNDPQNPSNALCDGLFKIDMDCDPVTEDSDGNFVKATFSAGSLVATANPAFPFWDAGQVLSDNTRPGYRSAAEVDGTFKKRSIWTVIDRNVDGSFTSADNPLIEFVSANAAQLAPLMQLDPTWCLNLFNRIGLCGPTGSGLPACPVVSSWTTANTNLCATQVIYYIRGWDVLDEDGDGCAGPGNPKNDPDSCPNGEERDRANDSRDTPEFWKLGDVFHSSPVMVEPPVDEGTCDLAVDPQCVATIHSPQALTLATQTPMDCSPVSKCDVNGNGVLDPGEDAYSMYRNNNLDRQEILLVGANDGMLHAFNAGTADKTQPKTLTGDWVFTNGTGEELWAFIPPDLLPRLKNALTTHTYFVDGDIMVRDIWYDDDLNGKKAPSEFRTVAVISERSGGSVVTALDITNTTSPQLRWVFPQLCTQDVNLVGQSWTGFAPRPPPIGPVQLVPSGGRLDPTGRGFEERWVVAVNGGYDPSLTRGKGVWLMDAWTGNVLWRFTNDDFQTNINTTGNASMWPVAASPALVDTGKSGDASAQYDGFFDTLTWADIGGQIWTARLDPPGTVDPITKRVTNWTGARAFEEQRQANDSQVIAGRSEFYFMPSNAVDNATKYLHTYVGSGNREHLLQVGVGCGPDNLIGCCQGGCNVVDVTTHLNYAGSSACDVLEHFKCQGGTLHQDKSVVGGTCDSFTCGQVNGQIHLQLQCGGGTPTSVNAHIHCDNAGNCCQTIGDSTCTTVGKGNNVNPSKLTQPANHSRFYGVWSYGGTRLFGTTTNFASTLAQAQTFDQNRFTDITYSGSCQGATSCTLINTTQASVNAAGGVTCGGSTPCSATGYDPGWFYEYGDVCPLASCSPPPPWLDEKTGSASDVVSSCAVWNTFRPLGSGVSASPVPCSALSGVPQNYNYVANAVSGVPDTNCGYSTSSGIYLASSRQAIAPPLTPTWLMSISGGKVQSSIGQPADPGSPSSQAKAMGGTRSLSQQGYWLEVPRDLHQCRHTNNPGACE